MQEAPQLDFKRTPVTLIIATIVVALEVACTLDESLRSGSLRASYYHHYFGITDAIWRGQPWRPFTCALMHGDLLHAAFNIYWFLTFGPVLERCFGSIRYLSIIVLLGYVSMMLEYVIGSYNRLDPVMIVGLSGIVYGMFGLLYVGRKTHREMAAVCTEGTKQVLIGWFFLCIALTYLGVLGVANLAHGTGFVFGVVYGHAAFGANGKQHLGWLCGASIMTGTVLAMLITCPGHEQYEQVRKWKAMQRRIEGHGQSLHPSKDVQALSRMTPEWRTAGVGGVPVSSIRVGVQGIVAADNIDPVESGRHGFHSRWGGTPPWYNPKEDDARPIEFSRPWWDNWDWGSGGNEQSKGWSLFGFSLLQVMAWSTVFVLGVLVAFVLVSYFRSGVLVESTSRREEGSDKHRIEALPFPMRSSYGNLLEAAQEHYRAGRYGEATKFLFSYQLVELDRARLIRLTRGKTNRRYLREMRGRVAMAPWVEETMVAFEDYFFGNYAINQARFEQYWTQLPQFQGFLSRTNNKDGAFPGERKPPVRQPLS